MSKSASPSNETESHPPSRGEMSRYLWAENPNVDPRDIAERFNKYWDGDEGADSLPRIEAGTCPICDGQTYYGDVKNLEYCPSCGGRFADSRP